MKTLRITAALLLSFVPERDRLLEERDLHGLLFARRGGPGRELYEVHLSQENLVRECRFALGPSEHVAALVPEDAGVAYGHGVRAKRSKAGAISFAQPSIEVRPNQSSSAVTVHIPPGSNATAPVGTASR